jgi:hypothetical protein
VVVRRGRHAVGHQVVVARQLECCQPGICTQQHHVTAVSSAGHAHSTAAVHVPGARRLAVTWRAPQGGVGTASPTWHAGACQLPQPLQVLLHQLLREQHMVLLLLCARVRAAPNGVLAAWVVVGPIPPGPHDLRGAACLRIKQV